MAAPALAPGPVRSHGEQAQLHYDMGRWDEAIAEYEAAYAGNRDPVFLYRMGETFQRKGEHQRALDLFRNFQEKASNSPLRSEVDTKITQLEAQLAVEAAVAPATAPTQAADSQSPSQSTQTSVVSESSPARTLSSSTSGKTSSTAPSHAVPPPESKRDRTAPTINASAADNSTVVNSAWSANRESPASGVRTLGGILTGIGIASFGVGAYFSWRTQDIESKINGSVVYDSGQYDAGKQAAMLQWVFYGTGAGLTLTGLILYVAGGKASETRESRLTITTELGPTCAGLLTKGVF